MSSHYLLDQYCLILYINPGKSTCYEYCCNVVHNNNASNFLFFLKLAIVVNDIFFLMGINRANKKYHRIYFQQSLPYPYINEKDIYILKHNLIK